MPHPPTIILIHKKERRSKCSVEPLRERDGFEFRTYPQDEQPVPDNYVRLGIGGPELTRSDAQAGLFVLDATWRLAERMSARYRDVPLRTLPPIQTAYPRVSKVYDDPTGGLATIEAIYAAYRILGWDTAGLLDEYRWADEFLRRNGWEEPTPERDARTAE